MDVKLEKFEGPLDLLLSLIRRSEIDIYDIPISRITDDYMEAVAALPPDMEQMSEFLVMAATLLEIKSKMLLPRPKLEEDEEDPREALTRRLVAYQQAQELAGILKNLTPTGECVGGAGDSETLAYLSEKTHSQPVMDLISLEMLKEIFLETLRRVEDKIDTVRSGYGEMPKERFSVTEKILFLSDKVKKNGRLSLRTLFSECSCKREMIATFLALLEMIRRGTVAARQAKSFGDVELNRLEPV